MSTVGSDKSEIIASLPAACADESAAVEFMERQRWGDKPQCPRCESVDVYPMKDRITGERNKNFKWCCKSCGKYMFTVKTDTIMSGSPIPLRFWCFAFWRAATSKKGVAALEIQRQTGLSYKSALFMMHRIRLAMKEDHKEYLRGDVVADETFIGGKPRFPGQRKPKAVVMALVERHGSIRVKPVADVSAKSLKEAVRQHVHSSARLMTDENASYKGLGKEYRAHETVNHSKLEYVRGDITTNSAESFFAVLKRGVNGVYHSVSKKHLHRYLSEFEFRYNRRKWEDGDRTVAAIQGGIGKRLLYREPIRADELHFTNS